MKAGDILLYKNEKGISRLIQWGTGSRYSHVAVCVSGGMNLAIEAMAGKGVRAIDMRKIRSDYDVFRVKEGYDYDLNKTISYLVDKLNRKYDLLGVVFLGLIKVLAKAGLPLRSIANKWQTERDYFCSELCYEAFFRGGGLDIVPEVPEADVTSPADISNSSVIDLAG